MADGLVNALTGAGTRADPSAHNRYVHIPMTDVEIDAAFRSSWLMRKIVSKPAAEMVREWRDWQAEKDAIAGLEAEEKRLQVQAKCERALMLAGLGGAGMVIYTRDTDQSLPLAPASLRQGDIVALHLWHRSCFVLGEPIAQWGDPWFGHPSYYEMRLGGAAPVRFHPSRVVAFKAQPVAGIMGTTWDAQWWGESTIQVVKEAVDNAHTSQNGFASLIRKSHLRRIYIPKLLEMVMGPGGEERLRKRVEAMAVGESSLGVTWLDGGDGSGTNASGAERIDDRQMTWTGMPDINASYLATAAAAADMPATVLLGKSPDGMNSTGAGDLTIWEGVVKARQDLQLRPCLDQLDVALVPSALGQLAKGATAPWWKFAPLSTPTEAVEATTFLATAQAIALLQTGGLVPDIGLEKGVQNLLSERGWLPGLDDALGELSEDERFPSLSADPAGADPSAMQAGNDNQVAQPLPRAANDRRFADAAPRTLYVQRKLLNADDLIRWAKAQGFSTTTPADELHVTISYSRQPLDWMKVGRDWSSDADGNLVVPAGGPRMVEPLGSDGAVVLLFASNDLSWRHDAIREAGASWDFEQYQPHVTITYQAPAGLDLSKVNPFVGPLKFGPELFSEIVEGWADDVEEE